MKLENIKYWNLKCQSVKFKLKNNYIILRNKNLWENVCRSEIMDLHTRKSSSVAVSKLQCQSCLHQNRNTTRYPSCTRVLASWENRTEKVLVFNNQRKWNLFLTEIYRKKRERNGKGKKKNKAILGIAMLIFLDFFCSKTQHVHQCLY